MKQFARKIEDMKKFGISDATVGQGVLMASGIASDIYSGLGDMDIAERNRKWKNKEDQKDIALKEEELNHYMYMGDLGMELERGQESFYQRTIELKELLAKGDAKLDRYLKKSQFNNKKRDTQNKIRQEEINRLKMGL